MEKRNPVNYGVATLPRLARPTRPVPTPEQLARDAEQVTMLELELREQQPAPENVLKTL